jgi:serine/threonine protein kinase
MEYVEDVEKYVPGGYHPVDIGDVIGTGTQQYEVIHKLGHGGFSTVWLVQSRSDIDRPSYFALKILDAEMSDSDDDELRVLQHLREVSGPLGHPNVLTLYHSFKISAPNGEHLCLVFPVLGPSLKPFKILKALSGPARHQLCCQVASGMAFLHETWSLSRR